MNIQKTVTANFNATTTGVSTFNIDLGAVVGVNIIQSVSLYFPTVSAGTVSFVIGTWDGATFLPVDFFPGPIVSAASYRIFRDLTIISSNRYLQIQYTSSATPPNDTIQVSICYLQIPSSHAIAANFLSAANSSSSASITALTGPAQGVYAIKSAFVSNTSATPTTVQFFAVHNSITAAVSQEYILEAVASSTQTAYELSITRSALTLASGDQLILTQTAAQPITYYISYTWNSLDT